MNLIVNLQLCRRNRRIETARSSSRVASERLAAAVTALGERHDRRAVYCTGIAFVLTCRRAHNAHMLQRPSTSTNLQTKDKLKRVVARCVSAWAGLHGLARSARRRTATRNHFRSLGIFILGL